MAAKLIVETGDGLAVANSYVTMAEADAYWELRNYTAWSALSDETKIGALVEAAQYLEHSYRYIGVRLSGLQAMCWPRLVTGWDRDGRALYSDEIPQRLKDAQCELAREAAGGRLLATRDRGGRVQSETVGPISTSYFSDAPSGKEFPLIDSILADLLEGGGGSSLTVDALLS